MLLMVPPSNQTLMRRRKGFRRDQQEGLGEGHLGAGAHGSHEAAVGREFVEGAVAVLVAAVAVAK